jgi:hypothetical protein
MEYAEVRYGRSIVVGSRCVLAVSILCFVEFLKAYRTRWEHHLKVLECSTPTSHA